ncbi:MAG: hypothetical protein R2770_06475 [Acidimicrobiales bacterium]|nr:hypothetical protein [Acidimicrobiales bacterium]
MEAQAYAAPNPAPSPDVKPGKFWYWIAGALGLAALVFGALGVANIVGLFSNIERFTSPQVLTVTTDRPVTRTVFTDTRSANVDITIVRLDGGSTQPRVFSAGSDFEFEVNGVPWYRVAEVRFPDAGTFEMSATPVGAEFALVPEFEPFFVRIGAWFGGAGLAAAAGLVVLIVTLVRRRRAKRRLEPPMASWGQPPAPGGWQAPPPAAQDGWQPPPPPPAWPAPSQAPTPQGAQQPAPAPQPEPEPEPQGPPPKSSSFDPFAPPPAPRPPDPTPPYNPIINPPEDSGPVSKG